METHTPLSEPPLQVTAGFCFRAGFVGTLRRREGVPCPCPQLTRKAALPEIQEEKGMSGGAKSLNALPPCWPQKSGFPCLCPLPPVPLSA